LSNVSVCNVVTSELGFLTLYIKLLICALVNAQNIELPHWQAIEGCNGDCPHTG